MKTFIRNISIVVVFLALFSSCVQDDRDQAKQVVQKFLTAVVEDDEDTAEALMPFLKTIEPVQKESIYTFVKGIVSDQYVLSVPDKKGSLYTVTVSIQGSENSTIHYSFPVKNEDKDVWIIEENISQKITYDSFSAD